MQLIFFIFKFIVIVLCSLWYAIWRLFWPKVTAYLQTSYGWKSSTGLFCRHLHSHILHSPKADDQDEVIIRVETQGIVNKPFFILSPQKGILHDSGTIVTPNADLSTTNFISVSPCFNSQYYRAKVWAERHKYLFIIIIGMVNKREIYFEGKRVLIMNFDINMTQKRLHKIFIFFVPRAPSLFKPPRFKYLANIPMWM